MNDHRIRPINVVFTSKITTVGDSLILTTEPALKIQIIPSSNGRDIANITIRYSNPDTIPSRLNEDITDNTIFTSLTYSMKGEGLTFLDRATSYMKTLPTDEVSVIMKEYSKFIEDGLIIDGLIAGIGSYLGFLVLSENGAFANQMPFQFGCPWPVTSGNTINHNMFSYISTPLMALSRTATGILLQLVLFIQSFINIWDPLFTQGPIIGSTNEARMCIEVISGTSNYVITSMMKAHNNYNDIVTKTQEIEKRLQSRIDSSIKIMRREINNLLIETTTSIKEISSTANTKIAQEIEHKILEFEHKIKLNITDELQNINTNKNSETELITHIESLQSKIDNLEERLNSSVPESPIINRQNNMTYSGSKTWNRRFQNNW